MEEWNREEEVERKEGKVVLELSWLFFFWIQNTALKQLFPKKIESFWQKQLKFWRVMPF
jgi:hypothetical protein